MVTGRVRRGVGIERGVMVATLVSCVILLFAAGGAPADPHRAEETALGEITARITRGLRSAWGRALAEQGPAPPSGHLFRWTEVPAPEPSARDLERIELGLHQPSLTLTLVRRFGEVPDPRWLPLLGEVLSCPWIGDDRTREACARAAAQSLANTTPTRRR